MDAGRLNQIEEIYHAVLDAPSGERDALLENACGADAELRREVESLLAFDDAPENLIDGAPEALAAEMFSENADYPSLVGSEIGHYKIVRLLGTGGMGEVYLAEDTKLRRKVALKLLPPQFSADNERKRRFLKEARAVSTLNHPNIITIYEIDDGESANYIATEFIDGQTFGNRIEAGPIPWREAVSIATQVAGALESAHSVGIIHRDIKPGNLMIRRDGIVKVLDFGLAKLIAPDSGDFESRDQTAPHRIMGTLNYMSPEQALGEKIDHRTDIYSFGIVLYEMLTGSRPFAGISKAVVTKSAMGTTFPSVCDSNDDIPAPLDQIVKHAIEKDRNVRYQSFADLRADLKNLLLDSTADGYRYAFTNQTMLQTDPGGSHRTAASSGFPLTPRSERSRAVWLLVPLLIAVVSAGIYWKYFRAETATTESFRTVKMDVLTAHGLAGVVAISPDGRYIVYSKNEDGRESLWIRQTASAGDTQIVPAGQAKYDFLRFSRDGNALYFVGTTKGDEEPSLYRMTTLGLNMRKLVVGVDSQITFSPDGKNIAFIRIAKGENSIVITDEQGGSERILAMRKTPQVYGDEVSWSPDGRLIAVPTLTRGATYAGGMAVVDVGTGTETRIPLKEEKLLRISQIAWVNDGKGLIYTPYAADMGQRYQIRYAAYPSGDIQNVTNDLSSYEDFSMTADSQTMAAIQRDYSMGIWLTPENDFSKAVSINSKTAADDGERGVSWTGDGKIVFVSSEGGAQNIWRMNTDGSDPKPLTNDYVSGKILPTLSIGGDAITYFGRAVDPVTKEMVPGSVFYQMDADGHNVRQVVQDTNCDFAAASANADWVVYTSRAEGIYRIWKVPLNGGDAVRLTDVDSTFPVISRDGKLIAYFITESGMPLSIGIISIDGGKQVKTIEVPATANIRAGLAWNKAGNGILFVNTLGTTSNVWTQPSDGSKATQLTDFKEFQIAAFALNADGTRLAVARGSRNRNVVLIKNVSK